MENIVFYLAWFFVIIQAFIILIKIGDGYVNMVTLEGLTEIEDISLVEKIKFRLRIPIKV